MKKWMTPKEIAAEFGLDSARTVRSMRANGLPGLRLGRSFKYERADVEAYIRDRKAASVAPRS